VGLEGHGMARGSRLIDWVFRQGEYDFSIGSLRVVTPLSPCRQLGKKRVRSSRLHNISRTTGADASHRSSRSKWLPFAVSAHSHPRTHTLNGRSEREKNKSAIRPIRKGRRRNWFFPCEREGNLFRADEERWEGAGGGMHDGKQG
jgi:hypothetical protein